MLVGQAVAPAATKAVTPAMVRCRRLGGVASAAEGVAIQRPRLHWVHWLAGGGECTYIPPDTNLGWSVRGAEGVACRYRIAHRHASVVWDPVQSYF